MSMVDIWGRIRERKSMGRERVFGFSRSEFFSLIFIVSTSNAMLYSIVSAVERSFIFAVLNTFGVSAIVWCGLWMGTSFALKIESGVISRVDKAVGGIVLAACFLPLGPTTWALVSFLSLYLIQTSRNPSGAQARAGWVFLALSVPMFWSKRLFSFFSEFFLSIDARLVSSITMTERTGNLVAMPDGHGYLQIAAPCSSMANVSLAVLCWVLFTQAFNLPWRPANVLWCAVGCLAVVIINVSRITLIGFFPEYYDVLHGPVGITVASWIYILSMMSVCYVRVRIDAALSL
ncbi:archaeosortase/exosortase family protein [Neorhizobium sp. NCHU2750]|uniref:archaeosortase/exosortase family protein n=1 Tax=Neorhizobium sp. NCHU2750 TaxID=1825976 RepID=UPI000EB76E5A|nr:hypothetical protein NCHU2750_11850 [Neorhizobium sp. NCHU2750]